MVFRADPGFVGSKSYAIVDVFFKKKLQKNKHRNKALEESILTKEPWGLSFISKGEQNIPFWHVDYFETEGNQDTEDSRKI